MAAGSSDTRTRTRSTRLVSATSAPITPTATTTSTAPATVVSSEPMLRTGTAKMVKAAAVSAGRARRLRTAAATDTTVLSAPSPSSVRRKRGVVADVSGRVEANGVTAPRANDHEPSNANENDQSPPAPSKTAKRRKVSAPPPPRTSRPATLPSVPAAPASTLPLSGAPALLPPTLSFSLSAAIAHLSSHDPRFRGMFTHLPCKPFQPPYAAVDPFHTLVTSIIGQQVSWMAARAITGRFKALFGFTGDLEGFPTPAQVARSEVAVLKGVGLSTRKAEYVISLAEHFVSGQLSTELLRDGTDEEVSKALIAVRGIGQWTVDMFLMFSLRRPDVLPVGDLGVQKGLLRWVLAAHGALPKSKGKPNARAAEKWSTPKKHKEADAPVVQDKVDDQGRGEIDTMRITPEPSAPTAGVPSTPVTPNTTEVHRPKVAVLRTPMNGKATQIPPTPVTPGSKDIKPAEDFEVGDKELPPPAPAVLLAPPTDPAEWDVARAAPLGEGLGVEILKSRLGGKKVKGGAYLTPREMESLTEGWRPYRSLGVYYMWPAGEDI